MLVVSGGWSSGVTRPKTTVVSPILAKTTPEEGAEDKVTIKKHQEKRRRVPSQHHSNIFRPSSGGLGRILADFGGRAGRSGWSGRAGPGGCVRAGVSARVIG